MDFRPPSFPTTPVGTARSLLRVISGNLFLDQPMVPPTATIAQIKSEAESLETDLGPMSPRAILMKVLAEGSAKDDDEQGTPPGIGSKLSWPITTTMSEQHRVLTSSLVVKFDTEGHAEVATEEAAKSQAVRPVFGIGLSHHLETDCPSWLMMTTSCIDRIFYLIGLIRSPSFIPFRCGRRWADRASRVLIWFANLAFLISSSVESSESWEVASQNPLFLKSDLAIAAGSLLSMAACALKHTDLAAVSHLLSVHSKRRGFGTSWAKKSAISAMVVSGLWALALSLRIYFLATSQEQNAQEIIHLALFAVSSFTLCSCALLVWHLATGMIKMVDGFLGVLVTRDLQLMSKEWNIVVLGMRKASDALQFTFITLAFTSVSFVFLTFFDLLPHDLRRIPNIFIAVTIPIVLTQSAQASKVTKQLPPLVLSMQPFQNFERDLQFVLFMKESEAGLYILDTRITVGRVVQFFYVSSIGIANLFARILTATAN
jgi:hypothetical protein